MQFSGDICKLYGWFRNFGQLERVAYEALSVAQKVKLSTKKTKVMEED